MNLLFSSFLILAVPIQSIYAEKDCVTHENQEGTCKRFAECGELKRRNLSAITLKKFQCTVRGTFCCPLSEMRDDWLEKLKKVLPQPPDCGFSIEKKIFGGQETGLDEFTWSVLLKYKNPQNQPEFQCGGSLINNRYVLTAAHCIDMGNLKLESVRVGEWDVDTDPDCFDSNPGDCAPRALDIRIVQTDVHPDFDPKSTSKQHDIALLRLARKVNFGRFMQPLCIELDEKIRNSDFTGHSVYTVGWGRTEKKVSSSRKLKVKLSVRSFEVCEKQFIGRSVFEKTQVCAAGAVGLDSCKGDSGGALVKFYDDEDGAHWSAIGVISYGGEECGTGDPSIYTKVSNYLKWMSEKIRQ